MKETHHQEHCTQDNIGVGTGSRDVVHHVGGGLRLGTHHYHILQEEGRNSKELLRYTNYIGHPSQLAVCLHKPCS